jgi:putative redox protein
MIRCETEVPNAYPQLIHVDERHTLRADVGVAEGGLDAGPDPHDLFDAALAACKALTGTWYAKRNGIPLERIATTVERDVTDERKGTYRLRVHVELIGPLTDAQRAKLHDVIARCPIHKLMTTTEVEIEVADQGECPPRGSSNTSMSTVSL